MFLPLPLPLPLSLPLPLLLLLLLLLLEFGVGTLMQIAPPRIFHTGTERSVL